MNVWVTPVGANSDPTAPQPCSDAGPLNLVNFGREFLPPSIWLECDRPPATHDDRLNGIHNALAILPMSVRHLVKLFLMIGLAILFPACAHAQIPATNSTSQLLEMAGRVEVMTAGTNTWRLAKQGDLLKLGDRVRTGPESRTSLRLSDKSVIRVDQNTVLEITPPVRPAAKSRFRIRMGSLFFLNREKPADIEFETPLATGAIRGTEFLLSANEVGSETTLVLYDGAVELHSGQETISLSSGQQALLQPSRPAVVSATLPGRNLIQWTFYYPGVLNLADLAFTETEQRLLANSLEAYRQGDLLASLAQLPTETNPQSDSALAFRAMLKLSVGRVDDAETMLAKLPPNFPPALALREVIAAVRFEGDNKTNAASRIRSSSEWLAHSYILQAHSRLDEALADARKSIEHSPEFGFGWERVAELEFGFGHLDAAVILLQRARKLSPRNAEAIALEGFIALEQRQPKQALAWFNEAISVDGALGNAWLGRALAHEQLRDYEEGRRDLQTAAALEPQRSLFRSYLAKGFSQTHDDALARKDFRLAKQLDPGDPTPWFYSALHDAQLNRINEAVAELERSKELYDNRSIFRSRLLLDGDQALRSADLSVIYAESGLTEFSRLSASRAVTENYADFSGHLFLARSLQKNESPNSLNLRYETPRQSELLVANLLAPPGGGNLSQLLSEQDYLQYFNERPFGASSLTEYGSRSDWSQSTTAFGTQDGFSYALDAQFISQNGQRPNNDIQQGRLIGTFKQQLTPRDSVYLQIGTFKSHAGDLAQYYDPASANPNFRVNEDQVPTVYAGYHHEWAPGLDTLLLVSHLRDHLTFNNSQSSEIFFLRDGFGGGILDVGTTPLNDLGFQSDFELTSVELQQIWEGEYHSLVVGGRYQTGSVENNSFVQQQDPFGVTTAFNSSVQPSLQRINGYAYLQVRPISILRLTGGFSYDDLTFPDDADLPPLTGAERHRSLFSPKAALELDTWRGGHLRAVYTRSMGGLYFDSSVRLEPAQLAGFTTAFRSSIPESVEGLVPGTAFETWGIGFDQSLPSGTYFGVEGDILNSDAQRGVGALSGFLFPTTPTVTDQSLNFHERTLSLYLNQLLGQSWSLGANYSLSEAKLEERLMDVPASSVNLPSPPFTRNERALLGHLQLHIIFNHATGWFAEWDSDYFRQDNVGYIPDIPGDSFWQHNVFAGYRFPRRRAEIRLGLLNLTDQHYRLNPLNLQNELPRVRTFTASMKLNF